MTTAVETLRDRARTYELNALAAGDRGRRLDEQLFKTIAITLYEVAEALEEEAA